MAVSDLLHRFGPLNHCPQSSNLKVFRVREAQDSRVPDFLTTQATQRDSKNDSIFGGRREMQRRRRHAPS